MMRKELTKIKIFCFTSALILALVMSVGCREKDIGPDATHDHSAGPLIPGEPHEGGNPSREPDHAPANGVTLTEEQKAGIDLRLAPAGSGSLAPALSFPGEIVIDQDSFIKLTPRVSGLINEVLVTKGDRVKQGQLLAVMESPVIGEVKASFLDAASAAVLNEAELERFTEIQKNTLELIRFLDTEPDLTDLTKEDFGDMSDYGSELVRSYADYAVTRRAFERKKDLYQKRIASQKDFLEAQGLYEMSRAEYLAQLADTRFSLDQEILSRTETYQASLFSMKAAQRQLGILGLSEEEIQRFSNNADPDTSSSTAESRGHDLTRVLIRSPRDGNILERLVSPGEEVAADTAIFNLADLNQVWARLQVPSRDLGRVKKGQVVTIISESGEETSGITSVIGPLVSDTTRTTELRVVVNNESGAWKPGLFVRGFVKQPEVKVDLLVPASAIQLVDGEEVIFIPRDGSYINIPVKTGRSGPAGIEILSGLEPGMEYVAEGAFALKSIMVTGSLDPHAGHGH